MAETLAIIGGIITILASAFGGWKWLASRFREAEKDAAVARAALHAEIVTEREKLRLFELEVAKHYVSKEGFAAHANRLETQMTELGKRMEAGFQGVHGRIDNALMGGARSGRSHGGN